MDKFKVGDLVKNPYGDIFKIIMIEEKGWIWGRVGEPWRPEELKFVRNEK